MFQYSFGACLRLWLHVSPLQIVKRFPTVLLAEFAFSFNSCISNVTRWRRYLHRRPCSDMLWIMMQGLLYYHDIAQNASSDYHGYVLLLLLLLRLLLSDLIRSKKAWQVDRALRPQMVLRIWTPSLQNSALGSFSHFGHLEQLGATYQCDHNLPMRCGCISASCQSAYPFAESAGISVKALPWERKGCRRNHESTTSLITTHRPTSSQEAQGIARIQVDRDLGPHACELCHCYQAT